MLPQLHDTLTCDSTLLHQFRSDEAYDYARELQAPDLNIIEWIGKKLMEIIGKLLNIEGPSDIRVPLYILFALVVIAIVGYLLWKYKPYLFRRSGEISTDAIEENNIYGINFEEELAKAMQAANYNKAVCIVYLQTLRFLADNKKINWQIYKTPTQYTREFLMGEFTRFTNLFMRVRYGNYQANEQSVKTMHELKAKIKEGGEA